MARATDPREPHPDPEVERRREQGRQVAAAVRRAREARGRKVVSVMCPDCSATGATVSETPEGMLLEWSRRHTRDELRVLLGSQKQFATGRYSPPPLTVGVLFFARSDVEVFWAGCPRKHGLFHFGRDAITAALGRYAREGKPQTIRGAHQPPG